MKKFKAFVFRLLIPFIRAEKLFEWFFYRRVSDKIRIIVGAGPTNFPGWFKTDIWYLDLTKRKDFLRYFRKTKIDNMLAEHVLEHIPSDQILLMLGCIREFASPGFNFRVAVPDGFHADPEYVNAVKPGGHGCGSDDHKNLFDYKSISELFAQKGFAAHPVEFWDENGQFHRGYENDDKGYISRSFINDDRNSNGKPVYTSLIVDFTLQK